MSILNMIDKLIISRRNPEEIPYHDWMDTAKTIILIMDKVTSISKTLSNKYSQIIFCRNFDYSSEVDVRIHELIKNNSFCALICNHERDIIRTQRTRERLKLLSPYGADHQALVAYRNKILMKKYLRNGNVPIAPAQAINNPYDALNFIEEFGYPAIIKPTYGSSSVGMKIVYNDNHLLTALDEIYSCNLVNNADTPTNFHIEKWIEGELFHTDGIIVNGQMQFISASKYLSGCLSFRQGGLTGSFILDENNSIRRRLIKFTEDIINSLPSIKNMVFHCEIFLKPNDQLVCCEIAARPAGGLVTKVIEYCYNLSLNQLDANLQAYLKIPQLNTVRNGSNCLGWVAFPQPSRPKRLLKALSFCSFPWVIYQKNNLTVIDRLYQEDMQALSFGAAFIISAQDEQAFHCYVKLLTKWLYDQYRDIFGENCLRRIENTYE